MKKLIFIKLLMIETLNKEIEILLKKHQELERQIEKLNNNSTAEELEITNLKKQKLEIKDKIIAKQLSVKKLLESD